MPPSHWTLLALLPIAYLIGAIPFGLLIGRAKGIDPRTAGSGNIGATNVGRLLGVKFFALVFTLDFLKGCLPVLVASLYVPRHFQNPGPLVYFLWLLVGFSAIIGHMFSCFIGFKGGKGVATSCGVTLGLFPYYTWAGLVALACWIILFAWKRYVSLASIIAAAVFPIAFIALGFLHVYPLTFQQWPLVVFAMLVAFMIIYRHRSNIARLRAGTESSFAKKKKDTLTPSSDSSPPAPAS